MRRGNARAACRVDLGGGTLDIWPLGLLASPSQTVNVAIDVWARATVEPRRHGWRIELDRGTFEADDLETLKSIESARLPARVADALTLPPATVRLSSESPRGAGLGASSAIAIALVAAIEHALDRTPTRADQRAALLRDVEAQMMGRPTGMQDFYPPELGGALAISYGLGKVEARRLDADLSALGARLIVAYSGQSHISADTNWLMVRACLDGDPNVLENLRAIAGVASRMPDAIESADWPALGRLMATEWEHRRRLADGVSTPKIESMLGAAIGTGAWGGKVCGAGGGGCVAVLVPPEKRATVCAAMEAEGATILEAKPTPDAHRVGALSS